MAVSGPGDTVGAVLRRVLAAASFHARRPPLLSASLLLLLILSASLITTPASAQQSKPGVVGVGDLVVTGASGTLPPQGNLPPGVSPLDETFIDPNGASLKVLDIRIPAGPPDAQLIDAPVKFQAFARDIGQVFGLAMDKDDPPNIYTANTSVHGLQIVVPDADGDGRPERIKLGQPGAQWMDGQFGQALGGGPGTIWKINGETGEITKFADVQSGGVPNSGPGLGNIAYDAKRKQLYVSDLDTGLIHRFDLNGTDLGSYDHGLQGRPAGGLNAVPDDAASRADITNPAFDAEDSATWGQTAPERRVWGLAVRLNRIYYAVEAGSQIWSVSINQDGSFGSDPRWELDVPSDPNPYPVSDIAFQANGRMLLAQRGGISSRYDYSQYHTPRKTRVLRYRLESPDDPGTSSRWVAEPEDYAIGFPGIHRNAAGGIAIGYGYRKNADGTYGFGACEGMLWSTGDALRDNPLHAAKLAQGGPLNVHGVQGNALGLVRPKNEPPWISYFIDYDGQFDDPQASGHVGDVEIARVCRTAPKRADLRIIKKAKPKRCAAGEPCTYEIEIRNVGSLPYTGPLLVRDTADGGARLINHGPPPWSCAELYPGEFECTRPPLTLAPGATTTLELTVELPPWWDRNVYRNCVDLRDPGYDKDPVRYNNRSCNYVPLCQPGEPNCKADLALEKFGVYATCDIFGNCHYVIRVTNVGADVYTGPLHIHDTIAQPASVFVDWDLKPQWNCGPLGGNVFDCSYSGNVTLVPGDFRELHVYTIGPPLGLGHTHERNCARIDWKGGPGDINPFNEYDCAEVFLFPPGHPLARPILKVDKEGEGLCREGAGPGGGWLCVYRVIITNTGGEPYFGPLVVTDTTDILIAPGASTLVDHQDSPPWNCVPGNGNPGVQTCTHPPIPGLQPGDSKTLGVQVEWPAGIAKPNLVNNCAKITHDNDGDGVAEEIQDCATTTICTPGPGGDCPDDLVITKIVQDTPCWPGFPCQFGLLIDNPGSNDFPPGLVITDVPNPDAGALNLNPAIPPAVATCAPAGPNHECTIHVLLPAGMVGGILPITIDVPPAYPWTTLKNCASIPSGVPGNAFNWNDEDCATAFIPGPDLAPFGDTECQKGVPCPLEVTVDNKGQRPFKGAAGLKGTLSPAVQITSISSPTPGFSCSVTGNGTYQCSGADLSLEPGASAKINLTILVPQIFQGKQISHIKDMVWPDSKVKDRNPKNDRHISIITVEQPKKPPEPPRPVGAPDLAITKSANQGGCAAGGPCGFTVVATSVGSAPFVGQIVISDIISPPNARLTASGPPPWRCRGARGRYTCTHPKTTLPPGAAKTLSLTFSTARNTTGTINNCAAFVWGPPPTRGTIREVQRALSARGFNPGPADGRPGRRTTEAIRAYQAQQGLPVTGRIDPALLASLLGQPGADTNPANDRACAIASIIGQPLPPPCTGGRFRNNRGICVCPKDKPVWTGQICIPRPPRPCTGGRYRDDRGICVCPSDKPVWTGTQCIPQPIVCSDGQEYNAQLKKCVCPRDKPLWTGQQCIPRPIICTGGRQYNKELKKCVCPRDKPIWTGQICIPKIDICSGGRVFDLNKKKCVCPSSKPIWDGRNCKSCTGGRKYDRKQKKCVCPKNKPVWNGQQCTQIGRYPLPGGQTTTPPGPSEITCTGGRFYDTLKKACVCPSSKPVWTGTQCIPRPQIIPQPGQILRQPGPTIR